MLHHRFIIHINVLLDYLIFDEVKMNIFVTKYERIVSCFMNKLILLILLQLFFLEPSRVFAQEVNAELVTISNGRNYFSFTGTSQPPLIVRGIWTEDAYMWVPINIGDTLLEMAFVDEEAFTGKSVAFDSVGNVIARYQFENGYIKKIDEYMSNDTLRYSLNFKNGIPHGSQKGYDWNGDLWMEKNFNEGILDGAFYWSKERVDYGLEPCIETGIFRNGVYERTSEPCEVGD